MGTPSVAGPVMRDREAGSIWKTGKQERGRRHTAGTMLMAEVGSTAAPAVVRCALAPEPERARALKRCGSRPASGLPRGRGRQRPRRARSQNQLHRTGSAGTMRPERGRSRPRVPPAGSTWKFSASGHQPFRWTARSGLDIDLWRRCPRGRDPPRSVGLHRSVKVRALLGAAGITVDSSECREPTSRLPSGARSTRHRHHLFGVVIPSHRKIRAACGNCPSIRRFTALPSMSVT